MLNLPAAARAFNELVRNPPAKASPKHFEVATNLIAAMNYSLAVNGDVDAIATAIRAAVDTTELPAAAE